MHGDSRDALCHLLAEGMAGRVTLVYVDPPYDSGADWVRPVTLRGGGPRLALGERVEYGDRWGEGEYLQLLYERLVLLRELLAPDGTVYVHLDSRSAHRVRCLMDEVLGPERFRNEIVWAYKGKGLSGEKRRFVPFHATILAYGGSGRTWFEPQRESEPSESVGRRWGRYMNAAGEVTFGALRAGREVAELRKATRRFLAAHGREPRAEDVATRYAGGPLVRDVWTDVPVVRANERYAEWAGYPTQKPLALLERIVRASSRPGDVVLDCFCGSGTALVAAERLGRRAIGADLNAGAIHVATRRLLGASAGGLSVVRVGPAALAAPAASGGRLALRAERRGRRLRVAVESFRSEAIARRLNGHGPVDWRRTVDAAMVDPAFDGRVLRPTLVDAPEPLDALVAGEWELDAPARGGVVAVKLVDRAGDEAVATAPYE